MKELTLALMLTFAGSGSPYVAPWLVKAIPTDAGTLRVWRDPLGCTLRLGGIADRVSLAICQS